MLTKNCRKSHQNIRSGERTLAELVLAEGNIQPGKMSASGRRVGQKVFDWVKISSRIPPEARAAFNAFRSRHEANKAK